MKAEIGTLLLIVGLAATIPLAKDEKPIELRFKREPQNHEIGVQVSHGSSSGTSGSISYTYRFKRSPQGYVERPETGGQIGTSGRFRRDADEILEKGRKDEVHSGTSGRIHYTYRFKRSPQEESSLVAAVEDHK